MEKPCLHQWIEQQVGCCKKWVCINCTKMWMGKRSPYDILGEGGFLNMGIIGGGSTGNNFSGDSHCKALWRMESGALTVDSKGTNTLTDNNTVGVDTVNFKEGAASADFVRANDEFLSIADANLNAGFPLKNDDTTKKISVCAWAKADIWAVGNTQITSIFTKYYGGTDNLRSFAAGVMSCDGSVTYKASMALGFNSGIGAEWVYHATSLSLGTWYHFTFSYNNEDKSYVIRIRNANGTVLGSDLTGTATLDANKLFVGTAPVQIGNFYYGSTVWNWDGLIDEVVVFDDIITADEATQIAKGLYR